MLNEWHSYPIGLSRHCDHDAYYRQLLLDNSSSLFVKDETKVSLAYLDAGVSLHAGGKGQFKQTHYPDRLGS